VTYGSVCSGIEAATVAWHPLGWRPTWFAEIDPFCCAALVHHYPDVKNYGDFTKIGADAVDVLVGGTPCQDFSVAGRRAGMDAPRGNLTLEFLALAGRMRPRWLVWENVPGVMSLDGGRTFGTILGILGQLGYGFAYRILDAQFFGVPQRRRRVFVVGYLGDWRPAAAVLFERHCLSGNPPPSRAQREDVAGSLGGGTGERGWCDDTDHATFVAQPLLGKSNSSHDDSKETYVAMLLNAKGGAGRMDGESETFIIHALMAGRTHSRQVLAPYGNPQAVAFSVAPGDCSSKEGQEDIFVKEITSGRTLDCTGADPSRKQGGTMVYQDMAVRRLTPRECERLQGFPDDYTLIPYRGKPAADGPRYRAIGNSMAVPVMRWIGQRIEAVEQAAFPPPETPEQMDLLGEKP